MVLILKPIKNKGKKWKINTEAHKKFTKSVTLIQCTEIVQLCQPLNKI